MKIGYVRVSTVEQNEARQVEALQKHDIERWYIEKISGKNLDRPKLQEMLDFAREGDTVYVLDWSRISRSTKDLLELVDRLGAKGVHLYSLKENFDTSTPHGRMVLTILGAINEFERANMLERQREGVAIAKREGKYKGRKKTEIDGCWRCISRLGNTAQEQGNDRTGKRDQQADTGSAAEGVRAGIHCKTE